MPKSLDTSPSCDGPPEELHKHLSSSVKGPASDTGAMVHPGVSPRLMVRHIYLVLWGLLSIALFWTWWPAWIHLALQDDRYTHIALVPFISLAVLYLERARIFANPRFSPAVGVPLQVLGLLIYFLFRGRVLSYVPGVDALAVVVFFTGSFLLCYGVGSFWKAGFPLGLLLLMIPLPPSFLARIVGGLQAGSAEAAYRLFKLAGVPVLKSGVALALPGIEIDIAPECSGIRSSFALLITGLLAGHKLLRLTSRQVLLALCILPIVIFKNAVRIVCISMLGVYVDQGFFYGNLHHRGGAVFAAAALVILVPVLALLQRSEGFSAGKKHPGAPETGMPV